MSTFVGENIAKSDAKGRVLMPSMFKRQMSQSGGDVRFVLKKSIFKNCLELYPMNEWEDLILKLRKKLNPILNKKHNLFLTQFSRGAVEVVLDSSSRILLNKRLAELVRIEKEIVFVGLGAIIELWDVVEYEKSAISDNQFEDLASELFGDDFNITE